VTGGSAGLVFAALEQLTGAKGRLERVGSSRGAQIFVDYAHKPDALAKALEALRPYATGRLVVVFGAGGDRDRGKRPLMGAVASAKADRVIVTDDNPRSEDAGDVLLIAGKGHETGQIIGDRVIPFSDHEAVATALKELAA
jgi:UDP-N-acetylmuramoyl-L-alanyl-D-glutamate--2,6-diaminopimelate ligase